MADPLDECPAYVKSRRFYADTLQASVAYRNVDENTIAVPPIASEADPFQRYVITGISPTGSGGTRPSGAPPGWNTVEEMSAKNRIQSAVYTIKAEANIYPEVKGLATRLADAALADLAQVEAIYDDWSDVYFWAAYSTNPLSCWSLHKIERSLWGRFDIPIAGSNQTKDVLIQGKWGACPLDLDKDWPYLEMNILRPSGRAEVIEGLTAVRDLVGEDVVTALAARDIDADDLYDAINDARARDRQRISQLFRHAYESLWCAEYGVAQGESYSKNKKTWQVRYGDMPVLVTPTESPGYVSPLRPGGPMLEAPHRDEECDRFGINCPPPRPDGGLGSGPTAPPIEQPVPEPAGPTKWYETLAGKVGIAVATLTVVGAGGYGIYYARQRA